MNCKRAERLIPLYVEGDLAARESRTVGLHLGSCRTCAAAEREYQESQRWLRSYQPPDFGDAFFQELNRTVLGDIKTSRSASWLQGVVWGWSRHPSLAAALVVLVLVVLGAMLLAGKSTRRDDRPERIAKDTQPEVTQPAGPAELPHKPLGPSVVRQGPRPRPRQVAASRRRPEAHRAESGATLIRIEFQTSDPDIRIIWVNPTTDTE
jgi:hypothetical protein